MPKRVSEKQLAANRRNALKSTGPRTLVGRDTSKMNALKHGILSRQVLVAGRHYRENQDELEALHQRLWQQLQPEGPMEEMLLDQIVTAHWRLRRALIAESGEIALSVDSGQSRRSRGPSPAVQWLQWHALGDAYSAMQKSSTGNAILIDFLEELRKSVQADGGLTEKALQVLASRFGGQPNSLTRSLESLRLKLAAESVESKEPQQALTETLAFIDRKISVLRCFLERCVEDEDQEDESRQAAAVLPSADVLDKILRYETKLERQMYRAMAQLERVQRMRQGEAIPAPLSVEVTDRS